MDSVPHDGLFFKRFSMAACRPYGLGIAILICIGVAGCGDARRAKIIGDWEMAVGKDLLEGVIENDPEQFAADADPDTSPKMLLRFFRSGVLETQTNMGSVQTRKQGYWELIELDEVGGRLTLECELTGQTTQHEVELVDENTIRLVPPNLAGLKRKIKFVRQ